MKKVAVITRTRNRPVMLPRARRSITSQSNRDLVWIIVNDAGEIEYVEKNASQAREAGVEVVVLHEAESTMDGATNIGIDSVESEYVVVHDDDDSWHPDFIGKMSKFLDENPACAGVICHEVTVYERLNGVEIEEIRRKHLNAYVDSVQLSDMLQENFYAPISFLFRRSVYNEVGGWDGSLRPMADWDFNLKVLLRGDIGLLPEKLAYYHIRESVDSSESEYGNSITAGINTHMSRDASYRNQKLREDLTNGTVGLGFLLCQGRQTGRLARKVNFMTKVFRLPQTGWSLVRDAFRRGRTG